MLISHTWLSEYLPVPVSPGQLEKIFNAIGLEVEGLETYESVPGGLKGLVIGEVLECWKHPQADKLQLTKVDTGGPEPLQIVCGAPNVAVGQKVVVAPVGAVIYPRTGEPLTMKPVKIRGEISQGMICAEDEIGLGDSHDGILVLPEDVVVGQPAAGFFKPYSDVVFSIGLTPNRSDAMSHLGVARDVCAWISHHEQERVSVRTPLGKPLPVGDTSLQIDVQVENQAACPRYAGVSIRDVRIEPSPAWLQERLKAIGLRPISNIVDITNYVLHETGQPLHAFDAEKLSGNRIIVKNLPAGTPFRGLDEKVRLLDGADLMICDGAGNGLCIGGVFGGLDSGVSAGTKHIFLEAAFFDPISIRKSSFRHQLRTDAALHFEKSVDIGQTTAVLARAATLICEIAGGTIASSLVDVMETPLQQQELTVNYDYIHKLSGKAYPPDVVHSILDGLGFRILDSGPSSFRVLVPTHKTDISVPADIVEEIMRIDGFDQIAIPEEITIAPSPARDEAQHQRREKMAQALTGMGFHEILCNSITNSAYYKEGQLQNAVRLLNNLSAELNILRPSMLETGLESIAHNLRRQNLHLKFFEFGKTYSVAKAQEYRETEHLVLFATGKNSAPHWQQKEADIDFFYIKAVLRSLMILTNTSRYQLVSIQQEGMDMAMEIQVGQKTLGSIGLVAGSTLKNFDIRQPVWYADLLLEPWMEIAGQSKLVYRDIPRFPSVERDLAFVLDRKLEYSRVEKVLETLKLGKLQSHSLFDVFESDRIGAGKKSMAMRFVFRDKEATLTDGEVDTMMKKIINIFEKELNAQIR